MPETHLSEFDYLWLLFWVKKIGCTRVKREEVIAIENLMNFVNLVTQNNYVLFYFFRRNYCCQFLVGQPISERHDNMYKKLWQIVIHSKITRLIIHIFYSLKRGTQQLLKRLFIPKK